MATRIATLTAQPRLGQSACRRVSWGFDHVGPIAPGDTPILTPQDQTGTLVPPLRFAPGKAETRAELEAKVDKLRNACGCTEGTYGLVLGLGFSWWLYFAAGDYSGLWGKIPATIGIALAAAIIGKFGALMWVYDRRTKLEARLRALS